MGSLFQFVLQNECTQNCHSRLQIYLTMNLMCSSLKHNTKTFTEVADCLEAIYVCMGNNKLKLNPNKIEFILIDD